ncbi:MAG: hypothetical protein ABI193_01895 [Minicystis sp.]
MVAAPFIAAALAALACVALLDSTRVDGCLVTRSSLDGFTVDGVGAGLTALEAAEALATLQGQVRSALADAARGLRINHLVSGRFTVKYGRCPATGAPAATITLIPQGPWGIREEQQICGAVVGYLRTRLLAAEQRGRLEFFARMF